MFVYFKYRGLNILWYIYGIVKYLRFFGYNEGCLKMKVFKFYSLMYNVIWLLLILWFYEI